MLMTTLDQQNQKNQLLSIKVQRKRSKDILKSKQWMF